MLTLAEVEADLSRPSDSQRSIVRATKMLKPLNDYIESYHLTGMVPATEGLAKRLDDLNGRVVKVGIANNN